MAFGVACFVCLETSPHPIQMGCACRGDAGLAHLRCVVQEAESHAAHGNNEGWWECRTCKQLFTGAIQAGLAEGWWLRVRDQPAESEDRLAAARNLAFSLISQGKNAEAEQMGRELLDVERRVLGPEHPTTLTVMGNLALSLRRQGKHAEAEQMGPSMFAVLVHGVYVRRTGFIGTAACACLPGWWGRWGWSRCCGVTRISRHRDVRKSGSCCSGRFECTSVEGVRSKRLMAAETARARRAGCGNGRTRIAACTFAAPASLATAVNLVVLRNPVLLASIAASVLRRIWRLDGVGGVASELSAPAAEGREGVEDGTG